MTSECQSYSLEFGKNVSSCQATNIINILFGQEKTKSNGNAFVHRSSFNDLKTIVGQTRGKKTVI